LRRWHALIVILYDTYLYFRPQISDNGATATGRALRSFFRDDDDDDDEDDDEDDDDDGYWL